MKFFKVTAVGLMLSINMVSAQAEVAASMPDGYIRFSENPDGGGKACSIPFVTALIDFRSDNYNCTNDQMTYFRLENVPSATEFELDSEACNNKNEWFFIMKTIKHPTTTGWLYIPDLVGVAPGGIITAGVQMVQKKTDTSVPYIGKLSCVRIQRSALP